ncbi:Helix-turn-helix domain-containing protein [Amphibacillus marinus]|uniref:Helix-turn-helix domain-containing protein n=1 Tax=Amphibacillus marinus TaxID=872970 RepID=A0A1H8TKU6_9BACI|nr:helix-turn-helix domain-containing protein [Amphibacillus marinus]SEO91475.1 Helix-turn-helix domain-containing protein [Amphibacillus marinus]
MVNDLFTHYRPITATPFTRHQAYIEIAPTKALAPYVCCFWGTTKSIWRLPQDTLVIPDTCMDIIFDVNFTKNTIRQSFCGIQDQSFLAQSAGPATFSFTFAIRFYAWSVALFTDEDMRFSLNQFADPEQYFKTFRKELEQKLIDSHTIAERIKYAETYLLKRINTKRENAHVMNAINQMLVNKGNLQLKDIIEHTAISQRQLERLFKQFTGVSPKKLAALIRHQYLWQQIAYQNSINIHDVVSKYGFYDQAHLLNSFKQYHTLTPKQALALANN